MSLLHLQGRSHFHSEYLSDRTHGRNNQSQRVPNENLQHVEGNGPERVD